MKYLIRAGGSKYAFHATVGPVDESGQFIFGNEAEVYCHTGFGSIEIEKAEVSMGAIGSHSPDRAVVRLRSYGAAIALAERVDKLVASGKTLEEIAKLVEGEVGEVRLS